MDFNQLKYLIEIVETGSISKAANNLFISQPNLSQQMSNLEKEIGKGIFYRTNRGVTLTSYGVEVYHYAKSIVNQFNIVEKKLLTKVNDNKVKIASFGSEIINAQFFEVCNKYNKSNYEFELYECGVEKAIEKVICRDSDIALIVYSDFQYKKLTQYLAAEQLEFRNLFKGIMRIHVSEDFRLAKKNILTKNDLKGLFHVKRAYLFEGMFSLNYEIEHMGIPENTKSILTNNNKTYNDALHNIPSFAMVVDWSCKKNIISRLKRIPYEGDEVIINCAVVKRKNEILKEELEYFIDKLIEAYG